MKEIAAELGFIIKQYGKKLVDIPAESFSARPAPGKWSKKEELGHLLDSAHSNLRRFVVSQHEIDPNIVYDQEGWAKALGYQDQEQEKMIHLWVLMNEQICAALINMPTESETRTCNTGKKSPEIHTLRWLAEDYVRHLLHHLHHILELEAVSYG